MELTENPRILVKTYRCLVNWNFFLYFDDVWAHGHMPPTLWALWMPRSILQQQQQKGKERKEKLRTVIVGILCRSRFANSVHILLKVLAHIAIRSIFFLMDYYFQGLWVMFLPVVCFQKVGMRWICFCQKGSFPPPLNCPPYGHHNTPTEPTTKISRGDLLSALQSFWLIVFQQLVFYLTAHYWNRPTAS